MDGMGKAYDFEGEKLKSVLIDSDPFVPDFSPYVGFLVRQNDAIYVTKTRYFKFCSPNAFIKEVTES